MKSRMKCIVCSMLLVFLTACSNQNVNIQDACHKWEQSLQQIIEDDVLHTTEKVVVSYDGSVGSMLEMQKYYDNGNIYYYCLQNENTEIHVVTKNDGYYLKTQTADGYITSRKVDEKELAAYVPYGKGENSFVFQVNENNVQYDEDENGVVLTYKNEDMVGEYMGEVPYESQIVKVYFDTQWQLIKTETISQLRGVEVNGESSRIEMQTIIEFHDTEDVVIRQKIADEAQRMEVSEE